MIILEGECWGAHGVTLVRCLMSGCLKRNSSLACRAATCVSQLVLDRSMLQAQLPLHCAGSHFAVLFFLRMPGHAPSCLEADPCMIVKKSEFC